AVTLATYSLGSCIGVCLYDAVVGMAGLLHYQLPSSTMDPARAKEKPLMFADTGLAQLVGSMVQHGAQAKRMSVKLAGGAEMLNDSKTFSIGRRNYTAIRKLLWQNGMLIEREDVGGAQPRTVYMRVADGSVTIKSAGNTYSI
ncbi:MAG TPA: chemotaxis protein CheD, partial [Tepidisphaeraceae bacterium]